MVSVTLLLELTCTTWTSAVLFSETFTGPGGTVQTEREERPQINLVLWIRVTVK